jgi:chromosome segregation ATPase
MIGAAWLGAALASLGAFLIGRFKGNQAARLACIDRAAAEERAEIWHAQAVRGAEAIGQLDQEIRAARLCRDQAEAERDELRAKLAQAQAEAVEARARVLLAWHEADQLEAWLNSAEDELDAARRELRQAEELAEELAEGTERQLAEEVIAARVSGWLVEDQSRRYEARIARRASLSVSRRSAPSAVHGPEGGQCEDDEQKKIVLQDDQGGERE